MEREREGKWFGGRNGYRMDLNQVSKFDFTFLFFLF